MRGVCKADVFVPLAGSPKFQFQPVRIPTLGTDWSVKSTAAHRHCGLELVKAAVVMDE